MERKTKFLSALDAEERIAKLFKGRISPHDELDIETKNCLIEVKTCNLLNRSTNGNHLRKYSGKPHKRVSSYGLGRFKVNPINHDLLYLRSLVENKIPLYVFGIRVENQLIWKKMSWEDVGRLLGTRNTGLLRIQDVWNFDFERFY